MTLLLIVVKNSYLSPSITHDCEIIISREVYFEEQLEEIKAYMPNSLFHFDEQLEEIEAYMHKINQEIEAYIK